MECFMRLAGAEVVGVLSHTPQAQEVHSRSIEAFPTFQTLVCTLVVICMNHVSIENTSLRHLECAYVISDDD
jgi:hypothetical protein